MEAISMTTVRTHSLSPSVGVESAVPFVSEPAKVVLSTVVTAYVMHRELHTQIQLLPIQKISAHVNARTERSN